MCRTPVQDDLDPDKAPVGWHDSQSRGLCYDSCVGPHTASQQAARPGALELLVHDRRNYHLSLERAGYSCRRCAHRRNSTFHVRGSAAIQSSIALVGSKGLVPHSIGPYYVQMTIEHQRSATLATNPRYYIRSARLYFPYLYLKPPTGERLSQPTRNRLFSRTTRHKRWVP